MPQMENKFWWKCLGVDYYLLGLNLHIWYNSHKNNSTSYQLPFCKALRKYHESISIARGKKKEQMFFINKEPILMVSEKQQNIRKEEDGTIQN